MTKKQQEVQVQFLYFTQDIPSSFCILWCSNDIGSYWNYWTFYQASNLKYFVLCLRKMKLQIRLLTVKRKRNSCISWHMGCLYPSPSVQASVSCMLENVQHEYGRFQSFHTSITIFGVNASFDHRLDNYKVWNGLPIPKNTLKPSPLTQARYWPSSKLFNL